MPQTTTLNYLLGDHLGSTSIVTNATGSLQAETRYKPWGEVRFTTAGATLPTRFTFTGQYSYISDSATDLTASASFGLMFYNARWYDVQLGRFAQADSIVPGGVQGLDRYAYGLNNPSRYIDPSGHSVDCGIGEQYCEAGTYNSLILVGSPEDIQGIADILNAGLEGTGYKVHIDKQGRVTLSQTGNANSLTSEQEALLDYLAKYINSYGRIVIKLDSGNDKILGDDWETGTVDVEDYEVFGEGPGVSSLSWLIHSLEEQYAKQVLGITDWDTAHFGYAVPAEEAVAGATRTDYYFPNSSFPTSVVVTYNYDDGIIVNTRITLYPLTVTKTTCSLETLICEDW